MSGKSLQNPELSQSLVDGGSYKSVAGWISENANWEDLLHVNGFIVFRGFPIRDAGTFDATLDLLMRPSLEFAEETSPRTGVTARIFTSTDYPQHSPIQFHHEFSYRERYPDRLAFCCLLPPQIGGATPLADSRKVLRRISPDTIRRFEQFGISYVRNFAGLGVSWEDSFGTSDKTAISRYCIQHNIDYFWDEEGLHTSQKAPAVVTHPATGERAWFNSVVNLNTQGIEPKSLRDAMRLLSPSSVPVNTTYGSGELIELEVIEEISQAYAEEAIRFEWQSGDLLVIDNILMAHARDPFEGSRRVIVGMGSALRS